MGWLIQWVVLGRAMALTSWVNAPTLAFDGLLLVILGTLVQPFAKVAAPRIAAIGSIAMWLSIFANNFSWNSRYCLPALLISLALLFSRAREKDDSTKSRWSSLTVQWVLAASVICLGSGYADNQSLEFYGGLAGVAFSLLGWRIGFKWHPAAAQILSTLILVIAGLPVADLAMHPKFARAVRADNCQLFYSFDAARGDPHAYGRWQEYLTRQLVVFDNALFDHSPGSPLPFRLKPGARCKLVNNEISVNSRGFRGREFSEQKGDAYRIVALGESTTFGLAIDSGEKPWPEALEELIRERMKLRKPVEVINAGVPAYTIVNNISRLSGEILPLHPDMIISYHGANGFYLIDNSLLPPLGPIPPDYKERPLKIAADLEHKIRMLLFRRAALAENSNAGQPSSPANPLQSDYAAAYRELIDRTRTNGVKLVIANYCMALNRQSPPQVIDFYQGAGSRDTYGFMRANAIHSEIVRGLAAAYPDVCFVDTHPHLDGEHEKFIDLMHFTSAGDRQLAENMFAGISNTLARALAPAP